jgi:hypothetical protein
VSSRPPPQAIGGVDQEKALAPFPRTVLDLIGEGSRLGDFYVGTVGNYDSDV